MSTTIAFQHLSDSNHRSLTLKLDTRIIPNVPRRRVKPPPGSPLSPIRSQKLPSKGVPQRPHPMTTTVSSPAVYTVAEKKPRRKGSVKVSFNEQVTVIQTIADDSEPPVDNGLPETPSPLPTPRRRSAGAVLDAPRLHFEVNLNVNLNLKRFAGKRWL